MSRDSSVMVSLDENGKLKRSDDIPSNQEIQSAFLTLWDQSVHSPEYNKKLWQDFRVLLYKRGIDV